jgi:hypothetical protein
VRLGPKSHGRDLSVVGLWRSRYVPLPPRIGD